MTLYNISSFIRYNNGTEELYDHEKDPHEWKNLADDPESESQKAIMIKQLESMVPALSRKKS